MIRLTSKIARSSVCTSFCRPPLVGGALLGTAGREALRRGLPGETSGALRRPTR